MATLLIRDQKLYLNAFDLTGDLRKIGLAVTVDAVEKTALANTTHIMEPGLISFDVSHDGFWNGGANAVDDVLFGRIGNSNDLFTLAPIAGADGEIAYFGRVTEGSYETFGAVGEMMPFSVAAAGGDSPIVRGTILHPKTARTATGNGTGRQLGQVAATQKLYAGLHVTAASGTTPSLTVTVQSDDSSSFLSPTTRITFTAATATTFEWATPVAGAITDNWWRIVYTITGTTPSFTFVAAVGVQ